MVDLGTSTDTDADPPSNPDAPPDSTDPSGTCARCGRVSNFSAIQGLPVTFNGGTVMSAKGTHSSFTDRVTVLVCLGCGQGTVVVDERRNENGYLRWRGALVAARRGAWSRSERAAVGGQALG